MPYAIDAKRAFKVIDEVLVSKLVRRDIHGNPRRCDALVKPGAVVGSRLFEDPAADRDYQSALFE